MKNFHHYINVTFLALLVSTLLYSRGNKEATMVGMVILTVGWVAGRMVREGVASLVHLMSSDEEKD